MPLNVDRHISLETIFTFNAVSFTHELSITWVKKRATYKIKKKKSQVTLNGVVCKFNKSAVD